MLENLLEFNRKSDGATKKKIPGHIFADKLVLAIRNPVLRGDAVPLGGKGRVVGKDRRPKSEVRS